MSLKTRVLAKLGNRTALEIERIRNGPEKFYGDPGAEDLPVEVQAVIAEAYAAHEALRANPEDPDVHVRWTDAKTQLREERRRWRELGVAAGTRTGVAVTNNTDTKD